MLENVYEGSKMYMKAEMIENVYEGLNARPDVFVYLSKKYFCEMYPTCVSFKLCELFTQEPPHQLNCIRQNLTKVFNPSFPRFTGGVPVPSFIIAFIV